MKGFALAAAVLVMIGALVMAVGGPSYCAAFLRGDREPVAAEARLRLAGGDGASMPVASPEDQGLDPAALDAAATSARAVGATALLVARRGHRVFEFVEGAPDRLMRSTLLSRLVFDATAATIGPDAVGASDAAMTWDIADPDAGSLRNPWSRRSRHRYGPANLPRNLDARTWVRTRTSELWQSLAAAPAIYERDTKGEPRLACCLWLRPRDALALAAAVLADGEVGGEHLFAPEVATRIVQAMESRTAPRGAEPFGTREVHLLRDDEGTRIYFFPAQQIAILLIGADEHRFTDETALAHQVLRGVIDRRPASGSAPTPRDLVPAH